MNARYHEVEAWIGRSELRLCHWLNRIGGRRWIRPLFRTISQLGDGVFWYALITLLALSGAEHGVQAALHLAAVSIVCLLLYRLLKNSIRRPRPCAEHRSITAHIAPLDEFSFPSGHTLHATAFSLIACYYFPLLGYVLVPFTVLVAVSRVLLGMHYPSDVLAAIAIGGLLSGLSLLLV